MTPVASLEDRSALPILHHVTVHPNLARPVRRVCGFSTRVLLLICGSMTIAVSVAVTLWTGLGPGPLDVFIGAVRTHTGLPLSISVWMVVGSLIALAWALGRRPGFGTLASPLQLLPWHPGTGSCSSTRKPASASRPLYADCHPPSTQVTDRFIPEGASASGFGSV